MKLTPTHKKIRIRPRQLAPISQNADLQALSAFFTKLNTSNKTIKKIAKRLKAPRSNRFPVKVTELKPDVVNVVIAKVLDEAAILKPVKVCCLSISEKAKKRIESFGGEVYTLDEVFKFDIEKAEIIMGDVTKRKVYKYHKMDEKGVKLNIKRITKQKDVTARPN